MIQTLAVSEEADCHCSHSWYDHIGWREGSSDKRVSCRIIGCGCECYTENTAGEWKREYKVDYGNCKPGAVFTPPASFNPAAICGKAINYAGKYTTIPQLIKDNLHQDARNRLPSGQYYEIRGSIPLGLYKKLYWIYNADMVKPSCRKWFPDLDPPELDQFLGCYIVGGYYA